MISLAKADLLLNLIVLRELSKAALFAEVDDCVLRAPREDPSPGLVVERMINQMKKPRRIKCEVAGPGFDEVVEVSPEANSSSTRNGIGSSMRVAMMMGLPSFVRIDGEITHPDLPGPDRLGANCGNPPHASCLSGHVGV